MGIGPGTQPPDAQDLFGASVPTRAADLVGAGREGVPAENEPDLPEGNDA